MPAADPQLTIAQLAVKVNLGPALIDLPRCPFHHQVERRRRRLDPRRLPRVYRLHLLRK
jgi:hypothetical protein